MVERRTQVTDDHQSILAWPAAGEGGVWRRRGGGAVQCALGSVTSSQMGGGGMI